MSIHKINWAFQHRSDTLEASISGSVLTLNGDSVDLAAVPNGGRVTNVHMLSPWLTDMITDGEDGIELTIIVPCGPMPSTELLASPPLINPADGPIAIPVDPLAAQPVDVPAEEPTDADD